VPLDNGVEIEHEVAVCLEKSPQAGEIILVLGEKGAELLEGGSLQAISTEVRSVHLCLQHKLQNSLVTQRVYQELKVVLEQLRDLVHLSQLLESAGEHKSARGKKLEGEGNENSSPDQDLFVLLRIELLAHDQKGIIKPFLDPLKGVLEAGCHALQARKLLVLDHILLTFDAQLYCLWEIPSLQRSIHLLRVR